MNHNCPTPAPLPENPSEYDKLQALHERQRYVLCRIQSAQRVMEALATEVSKESVQAGMIARSIVKHFRDVEMAFLGDHREIVKKQSIKVTLQDVLGDTQPIPDTVLPVALTLIDGGNWVPYVTDTTMLRDTVAQADAISFLDKGVMVYPVSILFTDGSIWDKNMGFRRQ